LEGEKHSGVRTLRSARGTAHRRKSTKLTTPDPSRVIASLARDCVNLDLKTVDLCFLAGLYLRANKGALASFEEDMLVDMFEQVCDVVEPCADNPRERATHAIQRLASNVCSPALTGRVSFAPVSTHSHTACCDSNRVFPRRGGCHARESHPPTGTLRAQLAEGLAAAKQAHDEDAWRQNVIGPLRVTVGDLVQCKHKSDGHNVIVAPRTLTRGCNSVQASAPAAPREPTQRRTSASAGSENSSQD